MALRTIFLEQDDTLRKRSKPVTEFNQKLWTLLEDMADTMHHANGAGLAAVQVGILKRVVVVDIGEGVIELINPEIIKQKGEITDSEGCLSCPGEYGLVSRPEQVTVKAVDRHGKPITITGKGLLARAFCHEIDHLNGKIYKDIAIQMLDIDHQSEDR